VQVVADKPDQAEILLDDIKALLTLLDCQAKFL